MEDQSPEFERQYSEDNFWEKVTKVVKVAGKEVISKALQAYYGAQAPETPTWAKTILIGALGYFISPIDAIPDLTPVIGYVDDLGALSMALAAVAIHITDETKQKANAKLGEWFGD